MKNLTQNELHNVSGAASIQIKEVGNELFITTFCAPSPTGTNEEKISFNQLTFHYHGCKKPTSTWLTQGEVYNGYKITFQNIAGGGMSYRFTPVS
jgi:hypothetical protein